MHRVAALVVHLELLAVEVAQAQRHLLLVEEGIRPAQARGVVRAAVLAEEHEQRRLVRLQHVHAFRDEDEGDDRDQREWRHARHDRHRDREQRHEHHHERRVAARAPEIDFFRPAWRVHRLLPRDRTAGPDMVVILE